MQSTILFHYISTIETQLCCRLCVLCRSSATAATMVTCTSALAWGLRRRRCVDRAARSGSLPHVQLGFDREC
eukprot:341283-Chlamydomonas_euryale.AAC.3